MSKKKKSMTAEKLQAMAESLPSKPPKYRLEDGAMYPAGDTDKQQAENMNSSLTACGTADADLTVLLIGQIANILPPGYAKSADAFNGAVALLAGIKPDGELEGALAVQMVACHILSMEAARRSMLPGQSADGVNDNLGRMNKLMRTFTAQTEALQRLRGQTKTVTVKHVTVASGAQAVIGDIHHEGNTNAKN